MEKVNENMLRVTEYEVLGKLPDPFTLDSGERITKPEQWEKRRAEIYRTAVELQYGQIPPEPEFVEVETVCLAEECNVYLIHTGTKKKELTFRMQLLLPKDRSRKFPVIVDGDACWTYYLDKEFLKPALDNGIGWAIFDRTEIAHDITAEGRGHGAIYEAYPEYSFGALAAWAWCYARCVDALEKIPLPIDLDWITFTGHSRGGKTVALAGAIDKRAKVVNPNETCAGGCGCYRIHMKGVYGDFEERRSETLGDIYRVFPFWFGEELDKYKDDEANLPFDAHYLKALTAPRILFISEAAGDLWANPVGSYQTTVAAGEVFRFLGAQDNLFWYYRPGVHGHAVSDVEMLVNIIKHKRDGAPLDERMFITPFKKPEKIYDWKCPEETK